MGFNNIKTEIEIICETCEKNLDESGEDSSHVNKREKDLLTIVNAYESRSKVFIGMIFDKIIKSPIKKS